MFLAVLLLLAASPPSRDADTRAYLKLAVERNLAEKAALGLELDARTVERTVVEYEAFKLDTFLSSGVFPKRYFGYFDLRHDTAAHEKILRETIREATAIINAYQAARAQPTRVNDAELAVTFIAEGGAILLRERQDQLSAIHPVYGVGLDDITIGFTRYPELCAKLDEHFHTDLTASQTKMMTFREAILGTAVMWLYEKELAANALRARNKQELSARSVRDQFIIGSLMYNSGLLFSEERVQQIAGFSSAAYLWRVSQNNAKSRWLLPLFEPKSARALLLADDYPQQETSWSAVYHVLQRYGGYAALMRFTDVFDADGAFR